MPAYQLYVYEEQEKREALEQRISEQVDACTEVNGTIRNRVKKFLIEAGITDISEMNAALRVRYEGYLERNETVHVPITCLRGFDRIFLHRMKEELKTLLKVWALSLLTAQLISCSLTPDNRLRGIRSLIFFGRL